MVVGLATCGASSVTYRPFFSRSSSGRWTESNFFPKKSIDGNCLLDRWGSGEFVGILLGG